MKPDKYILPKFEIMKRYILILTIMLIALGSVSFAQTINNPSELDAEFEVQPHYVKVRWSDNSNNEDGFLIERALSSDTLRWEVVGQVTQNVRTFYDYWIILNRLYHYRVYAYNQNGYSGYSNIDTAQTYGDTTFIPATPSNLRVLKTTLTTISIRWDDNASNELGFIIARKRPELLYYEFIDSVGTDVLTYQEVGLTPDNVYFYKVCAYNDSGISDYTNTVSARTEENTLIQTNINSAQDYYLRDNYPNPFNPSTTIEFGLKAGSNVKLAIYNSTGAEVALLFKGDLPEGSYSQRWNAAGLPSGTYFYRLEIVGNSSGIFTQTKKMILVK
jgi:hypothetical protein